MSIDTIHAVLEGLRDSGAPTIFSVVYEYPDNKDNRAKGRVGKTTKINCRFHVRAYLRGGKKAYDDREKDMYTVCSLSIINKNIHLPKAIRPNPYRSLHKDNIKELRIYGKVLYA